MGAFLLGLITLFLLWTAYYAIRLSPYNFEGPLGRTQLEKWVVGTGLLTFFSALIGILVGGAYLLGKAILWCVS